MENNTGKLTAILFVYLFLRCWRWNQLMAGKTLQGKRSTMEPHPQPRKAILDEVVRKDDSEVTFPLTASQADSKTFKFQQVAVAGARRGREQRQLVEGPSQVSVPIGVHVNSAPWRCALLQQSV